jgi:hypothetical protein
MTFPQRLKGLLEQIGREQGLKELSIEVQPSGGGRYVAIMRSESFEDIPEHVRQELVWQKILDNLDDYEQRLVEFVHTMAPSEEAGEEEVPVEPPGEMRKKPAKRR